MTMQERRAQVKSLYPGPSWHKRVDNMSDEQVFKIHMIKFVEQKAGSK